MGEAINIEDLRKRAHKRLPRFISDYVDGGAEDEITLRANRSGFEKVTFQPRVLIDVSKRDLTTTVMGEPIALPVLLSPAGLNKLFAREGELAAARAAGREGTIFVLSTASNYSIEEVAAAATGPLWFQLYPWGGAIADQLVERAQKAGYRALCVTVDAPITGRREREIRSGLTVPPRMTVGKVLQVLQRPSWLRDFVSEPRVTFKNLVGLDDTRGMSTTELMTYFNKKVIDPSVSWDKLARLRQLWTGPLVIKGIMTVDDARKALNYGVNGIIVSNHGGRQLDGLPATIEVLPEITDAVGDRAEVFIDGGIRRGADVVKAISLGAKACLIGRPYVWGLATGGETGVRQVLQILRNEIDTTLALLGRRSIAEVDRSAVRFQPLQQ